MDLYEKKYKEAQKWIESIYLDLSHEKQMEAEAFFPEIAESKDEKIRKWLIRTLKSLNSSPVQIDGSYEMMLPAIDWLERQGEDKKEINVFDVLPGLYKCVHRMFDGTPDGRLLFEVGNVYKCLSKHDRAEFEVSYGHSVYLEDPVVCKHFVPFENKSEKKSADKAEPKFHEGDWVILTAGELSTTLQIVNVDTNKKLYWFNDSTYLPIVDEECLRLWTIQDAKDGNVLYSLDSKQPFIFKHRKTNEQAEVYCGINIYGKFFVGNTKDCIITTDKYKPATKEQRDLLFSKMKESSYEWDVEKKELKKIEQKPQRMVSAEAKEAMYDNWSEEDEKKRKGLIKGLEDKMGFGWASDPFSREEYIDWLKSLKDRVGYEVNCTTTKEWSEEILKLVIARLHLHPNVEFEEYSKEHDWLKCLKQRIGG